MTPEEIVRFKRAYPTENTAELKIFVTTEIKLTFQKSKLTSIEVKHTEST